MGLSGKVGYTNCQAHFHFEKEAQGGWWTESTPRYFEEFPEIELSNNVSYKSQNALPDTTSPTTSIALSGTVGENNWYRSAVQITFSAIDNSGGSGVSQTKYQIDANTGTWLIYTAPFSISTNDIHTVYYKSVDAAGNWETEKSTTFKIDYTSPNGSFTIQNGSVQTYSTVVDLNTQASDSTSGVAAVHFRDAGQATWSNWYTPSSTSWQLAGSDGQTIGVEAQFKDNAGNVSAVYSDNIKINLYPTRPSSSLYTLQRSTFGASGMNVNSSQYVLKGTAGQTTIIGHMESSNYKMNSGYWAMNEAQPILIYPSVTSITRVNPDLQMQPLWISQ